MKDLNLSYDEINKEGALAIVEALVNKESLEKLELNGKVVCKNHRVVLCSEGL